MRVQSMTAREEGSLERLGESRNHYSHVIRNTQNYSGFNAYDELASPQPTEPPRTTALKPLPEREPGVLICAIGW